MTQLEAKELFESKLSETKAMLERAKNGDKLSIETSVTYMNERYDESPEFIQGKSTSMLANLRVRAAGHLEDEDPEFYYTIAAELKGNEILQPSKLESEYLDFDSRVMEFSKKLEASDNVEALIDSECAEIEKEGKELVAKMEASLNALKKRGVIAVGAVLAILALIFIIKAIVG